MRFRNRARILLLVVLTLAVAGVAVPAHAAQSVLIRKVDTTAFPQITLTVAVASDQPVSLGDVKVMENGTPVQQVTLKALQASENGLDVVLAIDTSRSMEGAPLGAAVAAAKAFIQNAPPSVNIGVLTFDDQVTVIQAVSADRSRLVTLLDALTVRTGTSLYDGVTKAATLFSGTNQRNIILLSDGRDLGSRATLDSSTQAAKSANAAVFSVGLQSPQTDTAALQALASKTGGTYSPAEQADLSTIYQNLLTQFSHQYLIGYRSSAPAASSVAIQVTLPTGSDSSLVLAPAPRSVPGPAASSAPDKGVLRGTWGMAVALGLCFLAVFGILVMLLGQGARQRREKEVARRLTQPGTAETGPITEDQGRVIGQWAPALVAAGKRLAESAGFMETLERKLERASLPLSPGEFVAGSGIAVFLGAIVGGVFLQSGLFALIFGVAAGALPTVFLGIAIQRRLKRLHTQLPDILMILASSLRAGHSFLQALDTVSKEVSDPGAKEFARVIAEIRLGRPVDESLVAMAERIGSDDFRWAVLAVNIQREVGGNLAEVLDTVAETVRERDTIRRQIDVLSAEGKLSIWILIALPVVIGLYLFKVNPDYTRLLYTTRSGITMLITSGCLLVLGVFWMRKIVNIDV
jgi:tight adherence protein B